jgi:hypothetical protein
MSLGKEKKKKGNGYSELHCDDCRNLYYELRIPKYHKNRISVLENGDIFLCHSCYNEENTDNSAHKTSQIEENYDDYDSDINDLYLLAAQN